MLTAKTKYPVEQPQNHTTLPFANPDDVPAVFGLIKELAEYEQLGHMVVATEQSLQKALFGDRPAAEAVLAVVNDQAIGFALFYRNISTFLGRGGLFIEDLYVCPKHRGKGVGRRLLGRLAQIASERRCGLLEWRALDWNEQATGFYRSLGATAMDGWTVYRVTGDSLDRLAESDSRELDT